MLEWLQHTIKELVVNLSLRYVKSYFNVQLRTDVLEVGCSRQSKYTRKEIARPAVASCGRSGVRPICFEHVVDRCDYSQSLQNSSEYKDM